MSTGAIFVPDSGSRSSHKTKNRVRKVQVKRHFARMDYSSSSSSSSSEDEDDEIIDVKKKKAPKKRRGVRRRVPESEDGDKPTPFVIIRETKKPEVKRHPAFKKQQFVQVHGEESSGEEGGSSSSEEDEGSDSGSSSSEEEIFRLNYVPKVKRSVVKSKEEIEMEEELKREKKLEEMERRKASTKEHVLKIILDEEKQRERAAESGEEEEMPDDEDYSDDESEYDLWVAREKARIIRDHIERTRYEREMEDVERRRNMSESERKREDAILELKHQQQREDKEEKKQFSFMQRYTKKGVFFQGEDMDGKEEEIFKRDVQVPTGKDKKNYKMMPKVLQNKYFGMKGQSKWTHLSNEDTTDWDAPWFQKPGEDRKDKRKRPGGFDQNKRRKYS